MNDVPVFRPYSETNPSARDEIQPDYGLRDFDDVGLAERRTALQQLINRGWIDKFEKRSLSAINYLNNRYLRELPGKRVHALGPPKQHTHAGDDYERLEAAYKDFQDIFLNSKGVLVLEMLSVFQQYHIEGYHYNAAKKETDKAKRDKHVADAFEAFDRLATLPQYIFEQFEVNQTMTRGGLVPRQDEVIASSLVEPTLSALSDPKWENVNADLAAMLRDFRGLNYPEVVTKAHTAVHRFLQIWTGGEEGKNGQGELGGLVDEARKQGLIPAKDKFVGKVMQALLSYLPSERASKSSAKPSVVDVEPAEAMLVMNTVFVLLQYCLQKTS